MKDLNNEQKKTYIQVCCAVIVAITITLIMIMATCDLGPLVKSDADTAIVWAIITKIENESELPAADKIKMLHDALKLTNSKWTEGLIHTVNKATISNVNDEFKEAIMDEAIKRVRNKVKYGINWFHIIFLIVILIVTALITSATSLMDYEYKVTEDEEENKEEKEIENEETKNETL